MILFYIPVLPASENLWIPGTNIQRTMRLLATSTPAKPNRVKILFYGQSITRQEWWKQVEAGLRHRFPSAILTVENLAIGGFAADRLKRTVIHDVFPSYPDLIVFHDYGGEPDYEELVRSIRSNVASEILVQSDHVVWTGEPGEPQPNGEIWHDKHVGWLRALAKQYRMGFVDVRTPWHEYLKKHDIPARDLLRDGVHLNDKGCALMGLLVESALVYNPKLEEDRTLVRTFRAQKNLEFKGNRVDVMAGSSDLAVLIDGKKPSVHSELIKFNRPSDGFSIDVPALARVDSRTQLITEDWSLSLFNFAPNVTSWKFRLKGSLTGDDGEGFSDKPFVSTSGKVAIEPGDWYVHEAFQISGKRPPKEFTVRFKSTLRGSDVASAGRAVNVANGLPPGVHNLSLMGVTKGAFVVVYNPPFAGTPAHLTSPIGR